MVYKFAKLKPQKYNEIDFDSLQSMRQALENIRRKKSLYKIYCETYSKMVKLASKYLEGEGIEVELGSGGGFMKELYPHIITSDVVDIGNVDKIIDAQQLPFEDGRIKCIYAQHVFHHIPDVTKFLDEANRVLCRGGGLVMVEPYWGPLASFLFCNAHPEPFDKKSPSWKLDEGGGPMSCSNQALSYIVFKRDKKEFNKRYPDLKIVYDRPFNCIRYMATGGLWLEEKLPSFCFSVLGVIEKLFWPIMYVIGIHHICVVKKEN